jgi:hypothetical protein
MMGMGSILKMPPAMLSQGSRGHLALKLATQLAAGTTKPMQILGDTHKP